MYKLSNRSLKQMIGMNPYLSFAVMEAIRITKQDFGIIRLGGIRTEAEQDELYAQGRTKGGSIVTWTRESNHEEGNAIDLIPYVHGRFTWEDEYFTEIAMAMKEVIKRHNLPIEWGQDLWKKDPAHWQIKDTDYDIRKIRN